MRLIIDEIAKEGRLPTLDINKKGLPGGFFREIASAVNGISLVGEPAPLIERIVTIGQRAPKSELEAFFKGLDSGAIYFRSERVDTPL